MSELYHFRGVVPVSTKDTSRPPMSPDDGPIVELFNGVWHAKPVTKEILLTGDYLTFTDFKYATDELGLAKANVTRSFGRVFRSLLHLAELNGGYDKSDSPFKPYSHWAISESRQRKHLLLSTQHTLDLLEDDTMKDRFTDTEYRIAHYVILDLDIEQDF